MAPTISPTQSDVQEALRAFLLAVLPAGDCAFVASIDGGVMTVTRILNEQDGTIAPGNAVLGPGVAAGTTVQSVKGGDGGVGTYNVSPPQTVPQATMSNGVVVIAGQQNRAAEPSFPAFVVMTPIAFTRLETNLDQSADVKFVGSIAGNILTVSDVFFGEVSARVLLFGSGVIPGTAITAMGTGSGGPGTYVVSPAQTAAPGTMACGSTTVSQGAQVTVQLDFHSQNMLAAGDMAQVVSTLFRDSFACDFFAALPPPLNGIAPLYADDPHESPFLNAEQQVELRWTIDANLFVSQTVIVPQQYADIVAVDIVSVYAEFPPT